MPSMNYLGGSNWGTAGDWSTSSEPIDSGDVGLTEKLPAPVTAGLVNAGVYLNSLQITPACVMPIGTLANPLTMSAKMIIMEGKSGFHFACEDGGGADKVDECRIVAANPNVPISLTSAGGTPGDWDLIMIDRGKVSIGAAMQWGTCRLEVGKVNGPKDAIVDIATNTDVLADLVMTSGEVTSSTVMTTANIAGGIFRQFDAAVTTVDVHDGGVFIYKNATASTITTLRIHAGGVADFTQGFGETTITTCFLHPGGTLIGSDQDGATPIMGTLIFTNPLNDLGGRFIRFAA